MSFKVHVEPSGREFEIEEGQLLLDTALDAGLTFPYGCRSGVCGACKCKKKAGEVSYPGGTPPALTSDDINADMILPCMATVAADLQLEIHEVAGVQDIPVKTLPVRIDEEEQLSDTVMRIYLKLPATERLQFLSGQYLDILLKDGRRRSFSIANAPNNDERIELHIKHVEGGRFTDQLFGGDLPEKSILRIEGPHGSFFLREDSDKPVILLATGTGFAPVKAIIEHAIAEKTTRPFYLYWGGESRNDLYLQGLANQWAAEHEFLNFIPVLSQPDSGWDGKTGYVQDAVMQDFDDLSNFEVYACGAPAMVYAGRDALVSKGLPHENYYSDAFEIAGD